MLIDRNQTTQNNLDQLVSYLLNVFRMDPTLKCHLTFIELSRPMVKRIIYNVKSKIMGLLGQLGNINNSKFLVAVVTSNKLKELKSYL